jgi:hypothetical protein
LINSLTGKSVLSALTWQGETVGQFKAPAAGQKNLIRVQGLFHDCDR